MDAQARPGSDRQGVVRARFRLVTAVGFALLIGLMTALGTYGLLQMRALRDGMWQVVEQHNRKIERTTDVQVAGFQRSDSLYNMMLEPDPFDRDAWYMAYNKAGFDVGLARRRLLESGLDRAEQVEYDHQSALIAEVVDVQERVVDLLAAGDMETARLVLVEKGLPLQTAINESFARLRAIGRVQTEAALEAANTGYANTLRISIGLLVATALLALGIALLVLRRVRSQELAIDAGVEELAQANLAIGRANQVIRRTFGRYLSDDIVAAILASPEGSALGGEKRVVSLIMADLRGFTPIVRDRSALEVVEIINIHMDVMTELVFQHGGTVDEIIGDAILAFFGAPAYCPDHAERALACALAMQLGMAEVNRRLRGAGHAPIAMGIGIATGEVVVGNIGSHRRAKYGAVGMAVNLAGRIQGLSLGGQVLVARETVAACSAPLRLDGVRRIRPKGLDEEIPVYEVGGIGAPWDIALPRADAPSLAALDPPLAVRLVVVDDKYAAAEAIAALLLSWGNEQLELRSDAALAAGTDFKLVLPQDAAIAGSPTLYAKLVRGGAAGTTLLAAITSQSEAVRGYLGRLVAGTGAPP